MNENKNKGFTLVELLAVIVILSLILVIAVPRVMSIIEDSKKSILETTVKMLASAAEKVKVQNTIFGLEKELVCDNIANLSAIDYSYCSISFVDNLAKITIDGSGKFEGLSVCKGTKTSVNIVNEECPKPSNPVSFSTDDWITIVSAVKSGNYPYKVGDSKVMELNIDGTGKKNFTIRVSNTISCNDVEVQSQTACGFILEFTDIIANHEMNPAGEYSGIQYDNGTTLGGWPASSMRTYVNTDIYNLLPEDLRDGIIDTYVVSGHGLDATSIILKNENAGVCEDGNYWSNDKLYLLSTYEIYGSNPGDTDTAATNIITRQLDYYKNNEVSTENYDIVSKKLYGTNRWWWLRSPRSYNNEFFYAIKDTGAFNNTTASASRGVAPAFRLSA